MLRCMREIKAGTVWFNDPLTDNDAGPFGGFKQSGLGRELGREGLEAFQETKHVHIETEIAPKDWWYPYSEYSRARMSATRTRATLKPPRAAASGSSQLHRRRWVRPRLETLEDLEPASGEVAGAGPALRAATMSTRPCARRARPSRHGARWRPSAAPGR